jgi:chromosome segregation protein
MHLEEVNVEGFKSFSKKTSMGFQPGIGVIIGNNGVGKSNILDAIVWALGEDHLDRIRCYGRSELFFAGSKDYQAADSVTVELVFRHSPAQNAPLTKLARKMDIHGNDVFAVMDSPCDRSTYQAKLEAMHMGQGLKTLIRQEEINDLIQMNPGARLEAVRSLLGVDPANGMAAWIDQRVAKRFYRYMSYLMPLAQVRLDVSGRDGHIGLDVHVTLSGNRARRAHQLSGGEKAVTSLALKLAFFGELESPFYLLDEVEPSLDYANHKSMQALLKDVAAEKQLIMITHLRSTIELANTLHGVRTRWDGSSFMKFYFVMDERLLRLYKCC